MLEPDRRRAIIEALNQDADRLVVDMKIAGVKDAEIDRFERKLQECNDWFTQLGLQLAQVEPVEPKEPGVSVQSMTEELNSLYRILESMETSLIAKMSGALPTDADSLEKLVLQHKVRYRWKVFLDVMNLIQIPSK